MRELEAELPYANLAVCAEAVTIFNEGRNRVKERWRWIRFLSTNKILTSYSTPMDM